MADPVSGLASDRLVSLDAAAERLDPDGVSEPLATSSRALANVADVEVGLWEAGPGTDTDTEADEVFVVLSGRGRVTFDDGSSIELAPGVVVRLRAGDETSWQIDDRLRKLYIA